MSGSGGGDKGEAPKNAKPKPKASMPPAEFKKLSAKNYCNPTFVLELHNDALVNWDETRRKALAQVKPNAFAEFAADGGFGANSRSHQIKLIQNNRVGLATVTKNLDKPIWGKFLLCRTIAPPFLLGSLQTVVQDPEGVLATRLMISRFGIDEFPLGATIEEGNALVSVGTVLAIKNPVYRSSYERGCRLVVNDWKEDVVIMDRAKLDAGRLNFEWMGEIREEYKKYMKQDQDQDAATAGATAKASSSSSGGTSMGKKERKGSVSKCKNKAEAKQSASGSGPCGGCPCCAVPIIDWKRIGNEFFVSKFYVKALQAYTSGLLYDPENIDLLANRAAAYLNNDMFLGALADCETVLKLQSCHAKGIFRKTRALWGLKRFLEAKEFLDEALGLDGPEKDAITPTMPKELVEMRAKAAMFIEQARHGRYDMKAVANAHAHAVTAAAKGKEKPVGEVDWTEYQTPGVEVKQTVDGKGRGLFATRAIPIGSLILVSKAFAYVPIVVDVKAKSKPDLILTLLEPDEIDLKRTAAALVGKVFGLIGENPGRGRICALTAGPTMGHLEEKEFGKQNAVMDKPRLAGLVKFNMFGAGADLRIGGARCVGIWHSTTAAFSFINHACVGANAHWMNYGDVILVRAARNIPAGEEIIISYVDPVRDFPERKRLCDWYGFVCMCPLCRYDRFEPEAVRRQREKYLDKFEQLELDLTPPPESESQPNPSRVTFSSFCAAFGSDWLDWLQELRPKHNLYLIPAMSAMMAFHKIHEHIQGNSGAYMQKLHRRYFWQADVAQATQGAYRDVLEIFSGYIRLADPVRAQRWLARLRDAAIKAYGTAELQELQELAETFPALCGGAFQMKKKEVKE